MFAFQLFIAILAALLCYHGIISLISLIRSHKDQIFNEQTLQKGKQLSKTGLNLTLKFLRLIICLIFWVIGYLAIQYFVKLLEFPALLAGLAVGLYIWLFIIAFTKDYKQFLTDCRQRHKM